jgi:hypothetical protein
MIRLLVTIILRIERKLSALRRNLYDRYCAIPEPTLYGYCLFFCERYLRSIIRNLKNEERWMMYWILERRYLSQKEMRRIIRKASAQESQKNYVNFYEEH